MSSVNLEEDDVHEIAYLTMKGWMYGYGAWTKEGQSIRDCRYYGDNCGPERCTDCYDRTDLTRDEAYRKQMALDD